MCPGSVTLAVRVQTLPPAAGVDDHTCFRIPATVSTPNGTVSALSDGHIGSGDDTIPLAATSVTRFFRLATPQLP